MTAPAPPRKPIYRTFVAERSIGARRDQVWTALLGLLDGDEVGPAAAGLGREEVLSFEPPWRRAARLHIEGVGLTEHTIALRDDSDRCLLVWEFLVEQPTESPGSTVAAGELDELLGRAEVILRSSAERVARAVEEG